MNLTQSNSKINLEYNGKIVFTHSDKTPFISIINDDATYKSSHGSFEVNHKITKRIPLINCDVKKIDDGYALDFKANNHLITCNIIENEIGLYINFSSNEKLAVEITLNAIKDEAIFGGGEQFRKLNMKGEKITNFVSEHIVVPPIVEKILFKDLYRPKNHNKIHTYAPMSTYVSSEKYAIRFNVSAYGVADFSKDNASIFKFLEIPKSLLFVSGNDFKEISNKLNKDIPSKETLPDWCFDGMILGVQGGIERASQKAQEMIDKGCKVSAIWCQDWSGKKVTAAGKQVYWNWEVDNTMYPSLKENIQKLNEKGIQFLAYINPYLVKDGKLYNYCKDNNLLIKHEDGSIYHVKSTTFDAGMMDLTNPNMVTYLKETLIKKNMLDLGVNGYMADFGEYLPVDAVLYNGDAKYLHNEWPTLWAKINREAVESHERANEVMFFTRSTYNGSQNNTFIMWNGDQHTDFTIDYGMGCVMPATFNLGFSGMPVLHSDIGGFISFMSLKRDPEVFVRWMEMNTFSPLMRSHETIRPEANSQPYDESIIDNTAKLSSIHTLLKPYIKETLEEAKEGIPAMRPDFYDSGDYKNHKDLYAYMFGNEIYVCPVIKRGAKDRKVNLPQGEWKQFFLNKDYKGNFEYTISSPLGMPIAFYKADGKWSDLFSKITY